MKIKYIISLCLLSLVATAQQTHNVITPKDPATIPLPAEEKGEVLNGVIENSAIYPGTKRTFQVLVPKGYDGKTPACVVVGLDGNLFSAITVIDRLVKTGEMPMTIGVFIQPGVCYNEDKTVARYNRSNEFDRTDARLATFIEKEVFPMVEKMKTADGRAIILSSSPNDRAITGASSSGIAAFTVAWERPDLFSRVYSSVGTFVAMRGGNEYPAIVRKTEPQRLRIYLQDGVNDTWNHIFGDWWEYNQLMSSALNFAGYEFDYKWDRGGHSIYYGTRVYPDAMRWLWRGWPTAVSAGKSMNGMLRSLLKKDSQWTEIATIEKDMTLHALSNARVALSHKGTISIIDTTGAEQTKWSINPSHTLLNAGSGENKNDVLTAYGGSIYKGGKKIATLKNAYKALMLSNGNIYVSTTTGELYLIKENKKIQKLNTLPTGGAEFYISPDNHLLVTTEQTSDWLLSYVVKNDGTIDYGQQFYWLHNVDNHNHTPYGNIAYDTLGNLYIATPIGIQVCDHNGRVRAILPLPGEGRSVEAIAFTEHYIYAISGGKLYVRAFLHKAYNDWCEKIEVKSQGAG